MKGRVSSQWFDDLSRERTGYTPPGGREVLRHQKNGRRWNFGALSKVGALLGKVPLPDLPYLGFSQVCKWPLIASLTKLNQGFSQSWNVQNGWVWKHKVWLLLISLMVVFFFLLLFVLYLWNSDYLWLPLTTYMIWGVISPIWFIIFSILKQKRKNIPLGFCKSVCPRADHKVDS